MDVEQSELPDADPYPHCYLPLHFWLDEGLVTKRVIMHPMVMRAVFLPGDIRNASGNGGGVLIGYMTGVRCLFSPCDLASNTRLTDSRSSRSVFPENVEDSRICKI